MLTRTEVTAGSRTEVTRISLSRTSGGAVRLRSGGGVFRAMLIGRDASSARVQLVPTRALLLAGDDVALEIEVEAGLRLELGEVGGTVAYDMRGGCARWRTSYRVEPGASLVHQTLPWVSAEGSDVERFTEAHLYGDAQLVLRETLVLGRYGEAPGALVAHTKVYRDGAEVLVEELHASDLVPSVGTGHRVLDQALSFGTHAPEDAGCSDITRLDLASGDRVWRRLDAGAHGTAASLDDVLARAIARSPHTV